MERGQKDSKGGGLIGVLPKTSLPGDNSQGTLNKKEGKGGNKKTRRKGGRPERSTDESD